MRKVQKKPGVVLGVILGFIDFRKNSKFLEKKYPQIIPPLQAATTCKKNNPGELFERGAYFICLMSNSEERYLGSVQAYFFQSSPLKFNFKALSQKEGLPVVYS